MPTLLYLETNYLLSIAEGRSRSLIAECRRGRLASRVAIPSMCLFEALLVFEQLRRKNGEFIRVLDVRQNQVERDMVSPHARSLRSIFDRTRLVNSRHFNEVHARLDATLAELSEGAELIDLHPQVISSSMAHELVKGEPADNLILQCILHHARSFPGEAKGFLSGNTRDFGTPAVRTSLDAAGLTYFSGQDAAFAWLRSQERAKRRPKK